MDFVLLKAGAASFLEARLNDSWASGGKDLKVKLYTNTVTLVNTLTAASFTEVISESGYAAKTLTCGEWTVEGDPAEARYLPQAFHFTGALTDDLTIKGYFVTDADDVALWAYEFDTVFTPAAGLVLGVYPKINLSKKTPAGSQRLSDDGALSFLNVRLNDTWPSGGVNLLLQVLGSESNMAGEFTDDAIGVSYNTYAYGDSSPIEFTLTLGSWTVDSTPTATYSQQQFTFGENLITQPSGGYAIGFVVGDGVGELFWGCMFGSAYQPTQYDSLYITPSITLSDGTPE